MEQRQGTFIVIEGTDGSGKSTQFKQLVEKLHSNGYDVATFDFPRYDEQSSYFVKQYLNGVYGSSDEVGPYTASLFYALDRYEVAPDIKEALEAGKVVIADRFTGSSMAHQGTKFANSEERRGYFIWLDNLEFQMLGIPRPDKSFVLRVPAETAQEQAGKKMKRNYTNKKYDIHEADITHLKRAVEVYDDLCDLFPKDFQRIDCIRGGKLLDVDTIQDLLWKTIEPLLPKPGNPKTVYTDTIHLWPENKFYIPETLDPKTQRLYTDAMQNIISLHNNLAEKLQSNSNLISTNQSEVHYVLKDLLPTATIDKQILNMLGFPPHRDISKVPVPRHTSDTTNAISLITCSPRNELDLINDIIYSDTDLSGSEIQKSTAKISYETKSKLLQDYVTSATVQATFLERATYSWDILDTVSTFVEFAENLEPTSFSIQRLSPRLGYGVPDVIEVAGLSDEFEACFELSLKLYSLLQKQGYEVEAQYATLLGHKMRWKVTYNAREAFHFHELRTSPQGHPGYRKLVLQMHDKLAEVHPLMAESMLFVNKGEDDKLTRLAAERYTQYKLEKLQ